MSGPQDEAQFFRYAAESENWNFGPLLELTMAFLSAADLRTAWNRLWTDPVVRGPWSESALTQSLRIDDGLRSARLPAFGMVQVPGIRAFGFKAGQVMGDLLWVAVPPRMARRAAPRFEDPEDPGAVVLHATLAEVARRIRPAAPWSGAQVAFEDEAPCALPQDVRSLGGQSVVVPEWVAQHLPGITRRP